MKETYLVCIPVPGLVSHPNLGGGNALSPDGPQLFDIDAKQKFQGQTWHVTEVSKHPRGGPWSSRAISFYGHGCSRC